LFGTRVRPRPGSVVHCSLAFAVEHSGIFVGRDQIIEIENVDGKKNIRSVDTYDFIHREIPTGFNIHVACDAKTGIVLGCKNIASSAKAAEGCGGDEYHLLLDNCHKFTSYCITGRRDNVDTLFTLLEMTISRKMNRGKPITWKVWNYQDDDDWSPDGLDELLEAECAELDFELIEGHEISCHDGVRPRLHDELRAWQQQLAVDLRRRFANNFAALEEAKRSLAAGSYAKEDIRRDLNGFSEADQANTSHWEQRINEPLDNLALHGVRADIHYEWQRSLERQRNEYCLSEIARRRAELMKELNGRLNAMREIADVAGELGINPGLLWDRTRGIGAHSDLETLKRWADYLKHNEGVRRLSELLGRMRRAGMSDRLEMLKSLERYYADIPDVEARSEIVGITQGRDLTHLLPQELVLLAVPDSELLFDLKYAEGRLMSYDYNEMIQVECNREVERATRVEEKDKLGPMIICVDTSGSMSGEPECVAKAITLALAMKSIEQKRECCIYSFSTNIEERDLSKHPGLQELLDFLQMSFNGGTDASPAIHHAIKKMEEKAYARADLLLISDFIMPEFTAEVKQQIQHARNRNCRLHALSIGRPLTLGKSYAEFDGEWQYDPATMGVTYLNKIVADVDR